MGLFSTIRGWFGGSTRPAPVTKAKPPQGRGRYDAARNAPENAEYWANADALSANAANNPVVRNTLRNRSRYEAQNNGYCKGLIRGRRNDLIGTGPRLQVAMPETWTETYEDPDFGVDQQREVTTPAGAARTVERLFRKWMEAADIAQDLRIMSETTDRDGETFAVMVTNPGVDDAVKLDLRLYEAEECSTPDLMWNDPLRIDGIVFDRHLNPVEYHFLKRHPGDNGWLPTWEYDHVPAQHVIHWFDADRPRQARGIPTGTPSLPLFSQLRRFTLATLTGAEVASNIAGILETELPPNSADEDAPTFETMDQVPIPRGSLLTAPAGWKLNQFDPKQPSTGYKEFKAEILTEAGRAFNASRNESTGSSAEYNYSSGRLDHLPKQRGVKIDRDRLRLTALNRIFRAWHAEASFRTGYLPKDLPPIDLWDWSWQWDGFDSIDRQKDAQADDIELANGTKTLGDVLAEDGRDWEEHLRSRARQLAAAAKLEVEYGLKPGTLYPAAKAAATQPEPEQASAEPQAA